MRPHLMILTLALVGCSDDKCQDRMRELEETNSNLQEELGERKECVYHPTAWFSDRFFNHREPNLPDMIAERDKLDTLIKDSLQLQSLEVYEFNKEAGWAR